MPSDPIVLTPHDLARAYQRAVDRPGAQERANRYRTCARLAILDSTLSNAREQVRTLDGLIPATDILRIREHLRTAAETARRSRPTQEPQP